MTDKTSDYLRKTFIGVLFVASMPIWFPILAIGMIVNFFYELGDLLYHVAKDIPYDDFNKPGTMVR